MEEKVTNQVANNEAEDVAPVLNEFCYCPENGMRQAHTTASFSSCPSMGKDILR